jgi:DNA-binding SARP family transcriptional activator/tetratricopeptide (TPR) repeat protein
MQFRILGPLEVWNGDQRIALSAPKPRALLAILLLHADQVVSTDRLIDELWGERAPPTARNIIQGYVAELRRALQGGQDVLAPAGHLLVTSPPGYRLQVTPGALDLHRFEELFAQAKAAIREAAPDQAAGLLRAALRLWRGPVLANVAETPSVQTAVQKLEERRLAALEERIEAELALGGHSDLVGDLRGLVAEFPFRERLRGQLMTALYRAGRQAEALQAYQDARRVLVEELGIEPCTELQRLHQAILAADPSLARPGGAQADAERPPPPVPTQLPPDVAIFTGRHRELERLRALLEPTGQYGPVVISAIDGTAGIGKSALAIYLAHRLDAAFPDGQLYANLHGTTAGLAPLDPLEVLGRFLRALGGDAGQVPAHLDEAAGLFRSLAAGRRLLVVLDDAASAEQVRPLLPASPGCGVLITSRRILGGLDGAVHLHLDVLAFEDAVALVALLAGRDRVAAEPEAIAKLVELCGRLPLALRIAGARLAARPAWTVETLVRRLDAEHQRLDELAVDDLAVRASFDVSYQSLQSVPDRAQASDAGVFRLLGLLETPDVAVPAATVLVGQPPRATEGALERLVDAHLLETPSPGRYRMHDLLRLFASERCTAEDPERVRVDALERTLRWYVSTTARASRLLYPADQRRTARTGDAEGGLPLHDRAAALAWLEAERGNLLATACQAAAMPMVSPTVVGELASALFRFLEMRGSWYDLATLNRLAVQVARAARDLHGEAQALNDLAAAHYRLDHLDEAVTCAEQTLAIRRRLGDRLEEGQALSNLGVHYHMVGRLDEAVACYEESLAILRDVSDRSSVGRVLGNLGGVRQQLGRFDEAATCFEEAIAIHQEVGDHPSAGRDLGNLGDLHHELGRFDEALACYEQALAIHRDVSDRYMEGATLHSMGRALHALGRHERARACWHEALAILRALGLPEAEAVQTRLDDTGDHPSRASPA